MNVVNRVVLIVGGKRKVINFKRSSSFAVIKSSDAVQSGRMRFRILHLVSGELRKTPIA